MYENISKLFSIFGGPSSIIRFEILNCLQKSKIQGLSPADITDQIKTKLSEKKIDTKILLRRSNEITTSNLYHHINSLMDLQFITIIEKDSSQKIKKYIITDNGEIFLNFIREFYSNTYGHKEVGIYLQDTIAIKLNGKKTLIEDIQKELIKKQYKKTPFIDYAFQNQVVKLKNMKTNSDIHAQFDRYLVISQDKQNLNINFDIQLIIPIQKDKDNTNLVLDRISKNKNTIFLFASILLDMIIDVKDVLIKINRMQYDFVVKNKDNLNQWFIKNKIIDAINHKIFEITSESFQRYIELDRVYMK